MPLLRQVTVCTYGALLLSVASGAARGDVIATVRTSTGELRIRNTGNTNFFISAYQITTPGDDLSVPGWLPVSGRLDVNGDMSLDPDQAWTILAPLPPLPLSTGELSEGVFVGDGGLLPPGGALYLGAVWNTAELPEVEVHVADDGLTPFAVSVSYLPPGDYDENGVVDHEDFGLWKSTFGTSGIGLLADGNGDQMVGIADYTVWRDNVGAVGWNNSSAAFAIATSVAVPEPCSAVVAMLGALAAAAIWLGHSSHGV